MAHSFQTIVHPTDFSDASSVAFAHALRLALATKGTLYLVHVANSNSFEDAFPHIRHALSLWKLIDDDAPASAVPKLGIRVAKVGLERSAPLGALVRFLDEHRSDLIVLATHGRDGLAHWLHGSISEELARRAGIPALFIPPTARSFVDQWTGQLHLSRILVPVDHSPPATEALGTIWAFVGSVTEGKANVEFMHVGNTPPVLTAGEDNAVIPVEVQIGEPVNTILTKATDKSADLIAMPTAGHHGFLDALRGSTTEQVIRHAPCPVLAVPSLSSSAGEATK
jgi:nucleotide-binding universal stress UspA family protein